MAMGWSFCLLYVVSRDFDFWLKKFYFFLTYKPKNKYHIVAIEIRLYTLKSNIPTP